MESHISREQANAEWAVKVIGDQLISVYSEVKDNYLRERAADIDDVVQRLLRSLSGEVPKQRKLAKDSVIVSQDLLPSAVAQLDLQFARAIATDTGGAGLEQITAPPFSIPVTSCPSGQSEGAVPVAGLGGSQRRPT